MIPNKTLGFHPADIQAELKKRGLSQSHIADVLNVSNQSVARIIYGRDKSKRIATYISDVIETPVEEIWPGQYN